MVPERRSAWFAVDTQVLNAYPVIKLHTNVNVNVIVNSRFVSHNREAPNALCTLVEREKKGFRVTTKTVNILVDETTTM